MLLNPPTSDAALLWIFSALLLLTTSALLHQPLFTFLHWLSVTLSYVTGPALAHLHLPIDHLFHLFHCCSAILKNLEANLPVHHDWGFSYPLFLVLLLLLLCMQALVDFLQKV